MNAAIAAPTAVARNIVLVAILLIAFALRCAGLDSQELRGDEAFGYFFSLPSYSEIVERTLDLREPHPVASYLAQHSWLNVAGTSEFALRYLGTWWGLLAVALMVPLASRLALSRLSGLVAAALMALSPYAIWHAQDARMYSMSLALTMASTLLAVCWWQAEGQAKRLWLGLGYVAVTWLALHTHYFALYIVVAQTIALCGWAAIEGKWRKLGLWVAIEAVVFLAWLPWLLTAWSILLEYHGNGESPGVMDALVRAQSAFGIGQAEASNARIWWALAGLIATGLGIVALWQRAQDGGRKSLYFLLVYWFLPLAATWLSAINRPIFNERYLVAIVPPVYLLMAAAIDGRRVEAPWQFWLGRCAVAGVAVGMVLGFVRQSSDPQYSKTRGWRELAATLQTLSSGEATSHLRLAQNYPDPTLWYYYRGEAPHLVLPPNANNVVQTAEEVDRMVADGVDTVILVEQPDAAWDGSGIARNALAKEYQEAVAESVERWPVSVWLRPQTTLSTQQIAYSGGLTLTGSLVAPDDVQPGGLVKIFLNWQGEADSGSPGEAVSLQLLNPDGTLVAQHDQPLEMASSATGDIASYAILLPADLPVGEYQVVVVVYDPNQAGAPRRFTLAGDDMQELAKVKVVAAPDP